MQNPDLLDALPTLEDGLTGASAGDDVDGDGGGDGGGGFGQSAGDGGRRLSGRAVAGRRRKRRVWPADGRSSSRPGGGGRMRMRERRERRVGVLGAARAGWEAPLESEAVTPPPPTTGGGGGGGGEVAGAVGAASLEASGGRRWGGCWWRGWQYTRDSAVSGRRGGCRGGWGGKKQQR
ncbi:hypothetical protein DFJ73DRAFT_284619 [Zopfochytrium polystomum]|nr:hypothetical protein DFJ73DRAFT_284619 [Zopfochytrium polystomum]